MAESTSYSEAIGEGCSMKKTQTGEDIPAEYGDTELLFGNAAAAAYATRELGVPVTIDQITYWSSVKLLRPPRKFGHRNIRLKSELREDLRGRMRERD
jgi:hypothetical protein